MECNAPKSYPASKSTYQWLTAGTNANYGDARPLHTDVRLMMSLDGSLEFANVQDTDGKKYWCAMRNGVSGVTQAGKYHLVEVTNGKDFLKIFFWS